jgi:hypothetical protein
MLVEKNIQKILNQLANEDLVKVTLDSSAIRIMKCNDRLSLTALVYRGENYIPTSVRKSLVLKRSFPYSDIRTFLTIDEQNYTIQLNYLGHMDAFTHNHLTELLEEFRQITEQWRAYLDEHDKHDLVHVRVK